MRGLVFEVRGSGFRVRGVGFPIKGRGCLLSLFRQILRSLLLIIQLNLV